MVRIGFAVLLALGLVGCNQATTPAEVQKLQQSYPPVRIAVLPDGTEVWRVADTDRWVYVATRGGNTTWTTQQSCGKGCTRTIYHQVVSP